MNGMSLEERIAEKRINFDRLAPFLQRTVDPAAAKGEDTGYFGMKGLWDRYVVPAASNLYERSMDARGENAYLPSEIDRLLAPEEDRTEPVPAPIGKAVRTNGNDNDAVSGETFPEYGEYWRTDGLPVARYRERNRPAPAVSETAKEDAAPSARYVSPKPVEKPSGPASVLPVPRVLQPPPAPVRPSPETRGRPSSVLKTVGKVAIPAAAAVALAAVISAYLRKKKGKRRKDAATAGKPSAKASGREKTASLLPDFVVGAAGRFALPELRLADKMFTAKDPSDYRDVNEAFREYAQKRMPNKFVRVNGAEQWVGNLMPTFSSPVFRPGDKVFPRNAGRFSPYADAINVAYLQGMRDVSGEDDPSHPMVKAWYGLRAQGDPRASYLTTLAATMLPNYWQDPSISPNVGNMAFRLPFVPGQTALDRNMSKEDIAKWQESGLDKMYMDALVSQFRKYPALRNLVSAFANGGFGRSSEPYRYGIENPMWDYAASAPTPYGSNTLYNVAHDIWNNGRDLTDAEKDIGARAHYGELLRFADHVAPKVLQPDTVLGNAMLTHPEGGLLPTVDKLVGKARPYFEQNENLKDELAGAIGKDTLHSMASDLRSKASEKAQK